MIVATDVEEAELSVDSAGLREDNDVMLGGWSAQRRVWVRFVYVTEREWL
jgi:hypothetical protein